MLAEEAVSSRGDEEIRQPRVTVRGTDRQRSGKEEGLTLGRGRRAGR